MSEPNWPCLSDEQLLEMKISKLDLRLEGTRLRGYIDQLYAELEARNLTFKPACFLADEWFCPVGVPAIGIPFFLAHRRLKKLEEKMVLDVEGGNKAWFMKLIRHESAHCYSYAYHLHKKKKWREIFGRSSMPYPDSYRWRPHSKSYVLHLDEGYAQSHPDEDFAETFAVWLTPGVNWKKKYRGWPALKKLEYVDEVMRGVAGREPAHLPGVKLSEFSGLNLKLKTYYSRKRKMYAESYPDFFDADLRRIFVEKGSDANLQKASLYLSLRRKNIVNSVALWTQEKKYSINQLVRDFSDRCDELNLCAGRNDASVDLNVTSYITSLAMNRLLTGRYKSSRKT